jgi:hypothetical protein
MKADLVYRFIALSVGSLKILFFFSRSTVKLELLPFPKFWGDDYYTGKEHKSLWLNMTHGYGSKQARLDWITSCHNLQISIQVEYLELV